MTESIFQRYYRPERFEDRFARDPAGAVDVIIPVIHTNELWEKNLISIYREVPVNRLLISDGGCKDNSIDVVTKFPRVTVLDHKAYKSLGYCLRKLIEEVKTDWFIYLHSDVYLPDGWFDTMRTHQPQYDWFGCPMRITVQVDYANVDKMFDQVRPYAGSQMGRTAAFVDNVKKIDDDFVYRQEDFVMASMVPEDKHGRIEDTFHYHQVMHKESPWARKLKRVAVQVEWSKAEEIRQATTQFKGIIKYLQPSRALVQEAEYMGQRIVDLGEATWPELMKWVGETNPVWLDHIKPWRVRMRKLRTQLPTTVVSKLRGLFSS